MDKKCAIFGVGLWIFSLGAMEEQSHVLQSERFVHMWVPGTDKKDFPIALPIPVAMQSDLFRLLPEPARNEFYVPVVTGQEVLEIMPLWELVPEAKEGDVRIKAQYNQMIRQTCLKSFYDNRFDDHLLSIAQRLGIDKIIHDILNARIYILMQAFYEANEKFKPILARINQFFAQKKAP